MPSFKEAQLDSFCRKIDYAFKQLSLLREALTHRSHSASHNERLEFLGDGVLNCAIAGIIFRRFPDLTEGDLSRLRANLVNQQALSEIALGLNLGELIRFGDGELKSGGNRRPSILADALEAVLGAVYLDSSFAEAEKVVSTLYMPILQRIDPKVLGKDPKTLLQEYLQRHKLALPAYSIVSTMGKAHKTQFKVACIVPKFNIRTIGEGTSRRSAEQEAAKHAYEQVCANS
jgi:ribonuclease III